MLSGRPRKVIVKLVKVITTGKGPLWHNHDPPLPAWGSILHAAMISAVRMLLRGLAANAEPLLAGHFASVTLACVARQPGRWVPGLQRKFQTASTRC